MARLPTSEPMVIVVAYRSDDHLCRSLEALGRGDRTIVVDNDRSPATRTLVDGARARYLSPGANVGFAAGVNVGLALVPRATDVLLLNPDAQLAWADVMAMQQHLHTAGTRHAAVGPRLLDQSGREQRADWPMPSPLQVWSDAVGLGRFWRGRRFITGAVLLLHADALEALGPLDERYFLYAEEADWQLRAQRAGWSVAVVDAVTARHAGAASSNDPAVRESLFIASGRAFARRWYGRRGSGVMRLGSIVAAARRSVVGRAAGRAENRRALRLQLHRTTARGSV